MTLIKFDLVEIKSAFGDNLHNLFVIVNSPTHKLEYLLLYFTIN